MSSRSEALDSLRQEPPRRRNGRRVASIDAFRGFVLLGSFIAEAHVSALREMPGSPIRNALLTPLSHSGWDGCTPVDLGFPAYIMLIAMSIVLSYDRRLKHGEHRSQLFQRLAVRSALLFVFATIYHGGLSVPVGEMRITRIFHRLAIAIFFSGLFELVLGLTGKVIALASVLTGYWALMQFVPVPGYGPGVYTAEGNLNHYIDRVLLGAETYFVLSTLGVAGTCLMGLLSGSVLLGERSPQLRLFCFVGAGIALVNLGLLLGLVCPINKHIWTPSFVVYSSGWILLIFSGFFLLTEVWGWTRWTFPLQVLGRNPLVAFASIGLLPWGRYADLFAGDGLAPLLGGAQPLVQATVQILLWWSLLFWLDRNNLIIKI
ncbi:MAG: acyltransferase family protein [Planctomycetaceae bacterium]